jgi:hypothetical protein
MTRELHFDLIVLLAAMVMLCPAAARATQISNNSVTFIDEWQMGEADSGSPTSGNVSTTVDDLGNMNLSLPSGATAPTYASVSGSGAYSVYPVAGMASTTCVNFSNTYSTTSAYDATSYLTYTASGDFTTTALGISTTQAKNWGADVWFNLGSTWPSNASSTTISADLLTIGGESPTNTGNGTEMRLAFDDSNGRNGLLITSRNTNVDTLKDQSSFSLNTWYHLMYLDQNGTGTLYCSNVSGQWLNNSGVWQSTPTALSNSSGASGSGVAGCNTALTSLDTDVDIGADYNSGEWQMGFNGYIDEARLFVLNTAGGYTSMNPLDTVPEASTLILLSSGALAATAVFWRRKPQSSHPGRMALLFCA